MSGPPLRVLYKVEGFSDLEQALMDLPRATARNVVKRALTEAAEPIAEAARQGAPVRSGLLRKSILVGTKVKNAVGSAEYRQALQDGLGKAAAVQAMRDARRASPGSAMEVSVGPKPLPYAHLVEFGSVNNTPHPFLRPAWDAHWRGALDHIKQALAEQIGKAIARARRKAERAAAKLGS